MKDYPKHIFLSFPKEKIVKHLSLLLADLENHLENNTALKAFKKYLAYLKHHQDKHTASLYKHLSRLENLSIKDLSIIRSALSRLSPSSVVQDVGESEHLAFDVSYKDKETKPEPISLFLILENIRSAFNVGSIFRTAECSGVKKIYLCGYTATPEHPSVKKTAMGTDKLIDWEYKENILELIKDLRKKNVRVWALETEKNAADLFQTEPALPLALVLGNERFGIDMQTLAECDSIVRLPVYGRKNSLNVANTAAIALYEMRRKMITFDSI